MIWVIQGNLLKWEHIDEIIRALEYYNIKYEVVQVIPFDTNPLQLKNTDSFQIPYGSTRLTKHAMELNMRGLFFNENTFRVDEWIKNRDDMFNADSITITIEQARTFMNDNLDESFFIRPVNDLKAFSGEIISGDKFVEWFDKASHAGYTFDDAQEISIAVPKYIDIEYRVFVVGRKVIDVSTYRINDRLIRHHITNPYLINKFQELADKWLPHETCVMDVARNGNKTDPNHDEFKVLEFNCFNSSGFYDHDIRKIVKEVSLYYE